MRIQDGQNPEELYVLEESESYYIVTRAHAGDKAFAVAKSQAAVLPEKQWRNVTAQCEIEQGSLILYQGRSILCRPDELRLRKVAVDEFKVMVGPNTPMCERYDVIIVEQCA